MSGPSAKGHPTPRRSTRSGAGPSAASFLRDGRPLTPDAQALVEVFENLPDAITLSVAVRDHQGEAVDMRLEYMNAEARARQTHPEGPPVGRLFSELWPDLTQSEDFSRMLAVLNTGEPASGSFVWHLDNTAHPVGYDYRALRVGTDLLVWVLRDSTETLQAGWELARSEERLRTVLSALEEGIILQEANRTVLLANAAAERMFALSPGHLPDDGREWSVTDEDGRPISHDESPAGLALATGEAQTGRVIGVPLGDHHELRWLLVNAYPLFRPGESIPYAAVSSLTDVTERKALEAELKYLALHDPLTGLPNRALLFDRMQQALRRSRRREGADEVLALLFVDLDGFKSINDRYGHEAGDQVLQAVASRLTSVVRDQDTVCRLGGDEFVILLEEAAASSIREVVRRLDAILSSPITFTARNSRSIELSVGASIGTALAQRKDTSRDLLNRADAAMYEVKQSRATAR